MQDRRVEIVDMDTVGRNAIANLIGFSMDNALFHAAFTGALGTTVTGRPPHRSVREAFSHVMWRMSRGICNCNRLSDLQAHGRHIIFCVVNLVWLKSWLPLK